MARTLLVLLTLFALASAKGAEVIAGGRSGNFNAGSCAGIESVVHEATYAELNADRKTVAVSCGSLLRVVGGGLASFREEVGPWLIIHVTAT